MAEDTEETEEKKAGMGLKGWLIVVILAAVLGGGGFYATYSGLVADQFAAKPAPHPVAEQDGPKFVELEPMLVTVGGPGSIKQLKFRAFLEVPHDGSDHVVTLQPRILDIFSTYLRALGPDTLEDPAALIRIRAQLLRRLHLLTGPDAVSDLLIIDFVVT
ncbi:flagellar basal body protein FliL [Jannaschia sp. AI_61]|nr:MULTISPECIES: flagellar basal body-associated FliL family protein [unclassified Jannaschia]GIT91637.1 flagellar basal body protein FliL [Jannaschia sp. AI_61]